MAAMTNGMLTDEQQNQVQDIVRLIPADERAAFLEMLAHDLRGREPPVGAEGRLPDGELRRVAERTWRKFLQHGWIIQGPGDVA
jgi:hypothetical protein